MKEKAENIEIPSKEYPFKHYILNLDLEDKKCLETIHIDQNVDLNGTLEELSTSLEKISNFIQSLGNNDERLAHQMIDIIFKIVNQALDFFQTECAYIMLRAFAPNELFKTPRWHQDGYYYLPYSGCPLKVAIPLKGEGTLFYKVPQDAFVELESSKNREQIAEHLNEQSRMESTPHGSGTIFIVGQEGGAIDSEPYINSQRFFMSVLPGTKKQIQEYADRSKMTESMFKEGKTLDEVEEALNSFDTELTYAI